MLHLESSIWHLLITLLAQAAITKYHRLGGLNNKHLLLNILEPENVRSGCQQGLFEDPLHS